MVLGSKFQFVFTREARKATGLTSVPIDLIKRDLHSTFVVPVPQMDQALQTFGLLQVVESILQLNLVEHRIQIYTNCVFRHLAFFIISHLSPGSYPGPACDQMKFVKT